MGLGLHVVSSILWRGASPVRRRGGAVEEIRVR